jgi:hypothetical protein
LRMRMLLTGGSQWAAVGGELKSTIFSFSTFLRKALLN